MEEEATRERTAAGEPAAGPQKLRFVCPYCQLTLEVPLEWVGVRGPCPGCQRDIAAPRPAAVASAPALEVVPRSKPGQPAAPDPAPPAEVIPEPAMPALGEPPPPPPPSEPNPPVPRQPPIPPQRKTRWRRLTLEERMKWGRGASSRRRGTGNATAGRGGRGAVDPTTAISERYRNRKEIVAVVKVLLAILATLAITILIVVVTKRSVLGPSSDGRPRGLQGPFPGMDS